MSTGSTGSFRTLALAGSSPTHVFSKYDASSSSSLGNSVARVSNMSATESTGRNARAHSFPARRRNSAFPPHLLLKPRSTTRLCAAARKWK
eukprot:3705771-Pyramimonas_sp.AAC.1